MPAPVTDGRGPRLISSAANPLIKRMRLLSAERKHRRREAAFVVEGIQPVWQAVEAGADVEVLVIAPELLGDSPAARMAATAEDAGTKVVRLTGELFARLSGRDGPSGLAAIVRGQPLGLADVAAGPDAVFAGLCGIGNPGNLGTIIRTVNAAGAAGVVLLGDTADAFSPAAVKASMGALFTTPVAHAADAETFFGWAAAAEVTVVTTSAAAPASFWEASYPRPLVVLLGAEGTGLPEQVLARGDVCVRVPMAGTAESLNLAVAASLLLYEVQRPVLARLPPPGTPEG
jgi:TrmH family RNA methyltransferase